MHLTGCIEQNITCNEHHHFSKMEACFLHPVWFKFLSWWKWAHGVDLWKVTLRWCFFASPAKRSADDEDEDQYDNSFINDESEEEEVGDDSDYMPESEDSGKEDIKRLQKEAQAFLRKKK